jgi:cyclic pyranopterin phosphate synthase
MGEMSRAEIRQAFRETVANRVPYYGEYMVEEDGEWVLNDDYIERPPAPAADDD